MITFRLSEELELVRQTASKFALEEIRPAARTAEASGELPSSLLAQYRELGFGALDLPEALGGLGLGMTGRVVAEEALAAGDAGIALAFPSSIPLATVALALGNEAQAQRAIAELEAGRRGAMAWSEPRPKAGTFSTIAEQKADQSWRLAGAKTEVVLADRAGLFAVFAELRDRDGRVRPGAFLVDAKTRGVRVGPRIEGLGLSAAPTSGVTFEDVVLPESDRLGAADLRFDAAVVETLCRIGLCGAARGVGLASAAFELAHGWAKDRQAFGKPIAHFQGLAFLIADMATELEAMRAMVLRAAWAFDHHKKDAVQMAAMAISECHEGAMFLTNNTVQVLGGSGYIRDFLAEKWMRDAKAHMSHALPRQLCDLLVGRLALEGGGPILTEDAPMPEIQSVFV